MLTREAVVECKHEDTKYQTNSCGDRNCPAFCGASGGFNCGVIDVLKRRLIEIAVRVGVRIEEEALGAALHGGDYMIGMIRT